MLTAAFALSLPIGIQASDPGADAPQAKIKRRAVESESLASVGYHAASQTLEIEFRTGELYRYAAVPKAEFQGLIRAASKGRYFSEKIRGKFEFRQVRGKLP